MLGFCLRYIGLFGIVLQRAEAGNIGKFHADARKFIAQVAHVPGHIVANDHAALFKIAVNFIGVVGKQVAAGKFAQLPHAQPMHLARMAVDGIHGEIKVLPPARGGRR